MSGGQIMVMVIVAMALMASIYKARYKSDAVATPTRAADAERLRDEVRMLKERIAVLERIATDKDSHLDREIERLRDR